MESELIKAIPGGGPLVVFVVIVMILTRQNQQAVAAFQSQIQGLTDTVFKIQLDMSKALNELTTAVRELQLKTRGRDGE